MQRGREAPKASFLLQIYLVMVDRWANTGTVNGKLKYQNPSFKTKFVSEACPEPQRTKTRQLIAAENAVPPPNRLLHFTFTGRAELALCVAISRAILYARVFSTLPPAPPDARLLLHH